MVRHWLTAFVVGRSGSSTALEVDQGCDSSARYSLGVMPKRARKARLKGPTDP
jgi:hypothetical protein